MMRREAASREGAPDSRPMRLGADSNHAGCLCAGCRPVDGGNPAAGLTAELHRAQFGRVLVTIGRAHPLGCSEQVLATPSAMVKGGNRRA
jgi:hypothetical protein